MADKRLKLHEGGRSELLKGPTINPYKFHGLTPPPPATAGHLQYLPHTTLDQRYRRVAVRYKYEGRRHMVGNVNIMIWYPITIFGVNGNSVTYITV